MFRYHTLAAVLATIYAPKTLRSLTLRGCRATAALSFGLGSCEALVQLDASGCEFLRALPMTLFRLLSIQTPS